MPEEEEEGVRSPETGVTGINCCVSPMEEQPVLVTAEPSLQSHKNLFKNFEITFFHYAYMCVCVLAPSWVMYTGDERTTCGSWLSPSTTWGLGIKGMLPGLVATLPVELSCNPCQ